MPHALTAIERRILGLICTALTKSGRPPSLEELRKDAGVHSVESLHGYLDRLQRKGLIRRDPALPRAIEVDCQSVGVVASVAPAAEPTPKTADTPSGEPQTSPTPEKESVSATDTASAAPDPVVKAEDGYTTPRHPETDVADVPFLGDIAAGSPILTPDTSIREALAIYRLPTDLVGRGRTLVMMRIRGDSMRDAGILDDDFVVVRWQQVADDGEIVAAFVEGAATVKRLSRRRGRVQLLSDTPGFPPIDAKDGMILGKVVTVIRRLG